MHRKVHSLSRCDSARDVDDNHNDNDVWQSNREGDREAKRVRKKERRRSMTLPGNLHIYRICLLCIQPAAEVLSYLNCRTLLSG